MADAAFGQCVKLNSSSVEVTLENFQQFHLSLTRLLAICHQRLVYYGASAKPYAMYYFVYLETSDYGLRFSSRCISGLILVFPLHFVVK